MATLDRVSSKVIVLFYNASTNEQIARYSTASVMPYAIGQQVRVAVGPIGASRKILGRISWIRFNVATYEDPSDVEQVMEVYVTPEPGA